MGKLSRSALGLLALTAPLILVAPALADEVKDGVEAWERGDYARAVEEWRGPAMKGNADAQFNLAQAYKLGRGVPQDLNQAQMWYEKAAAQGHLQAEDNLGLLLFQKGDRQRAMPMIERSSARGEPRAQYILGTAYFNGDLMPKDWVKAYALMTRASQVGLPQASQTLAQMDQYIPLDQRQQGMTMARDMEANQMRPAATLASASPAPRPPASKPPSSKSPQGKPPVITTPYQIPGGATPAPTPKPPVYAGPGTSYPVPGSKPTPVATPKPASKPPTATASSPTQVRSGTGKGWRIQLGAFSDPNRAKSLWDDSKRSIPGLASLQPYLQNTGTVTRLQAGPFGSEGEASRACKEVTTRGGECRVVKQ